MPYTVAGRDTRGSGGAEHTTNFRHLNFDYDYPRELDLEPGSEMHQNILSRIKRRAQQSHSAMSNKHSDWQEIDQSLKGYVRREWDREEDDEDNSPMPQVVLPHSYANLETILTYMTTAFLQDPIFRFDPQGPEDAHKAFLLERVIAHQARKKNFGLNLHTMWRDGFAYGIGVVAPKWTEEYGTRTRVQDEGFLDRIANVFNVTNKRRVQSERVKMYEGHILENIDPYRFLPDPSNPIHEVQKAQFVGWISRSNEMELLRREQNQDGFFNAKYVREGVADARSQFILGEENQSRRRDVNDEQVTENDPVDEVWMYVDLIPSEWGLGRSDRPEKWQFAIAGEQVVTAARPLNLHHNRFPVAVIAPDYDGHTVTPPSRMGLIQDMQQVIDFLYSSHLLNIRKAINDMFIVDPKLVNIHDVSDPEPGKLIRMRRMAWGQGRIDEGIKQLEVADVTQQHIEEGNYLLNIMEESTGATDMAKGITQNQGSRVSATEAQGARQSVLSRMQKAARIIGMQGHQPLGELLALQTQQLMDDEQWVQVIGEAGERNRNRLSQEVEGGKVAVQPEDIVIPFDVQAVDPSVPGSEDLETWTDLYQTVAQNPQLAQQFDMVRMFKHIARQMGAKNVDDFIQRMNPPQVMEDQNVEEEARKGNLEPVQNQSNGRQRA